MTKLQKGARESLREIIVTASTHTGLGKAPVFKCDRNGRAMAVLSCTAACFSLAVVVGTGYSGSSGAVYMVAATCAATSL